MKRILRFVPLVVLCLLLMLMLPQQVNAATTSGSWAGVFWELDTIWGELVISKGGDSGSGYMNPFSIDSAGAWRAYKSSIKTVTILDGVTNISQCAFYGCSNLTSISIPNTVTSLGIRSFSGCTRLSEIMIPVSVKSLNKNAFELCTSLDDVYYEGTEQEWGAISIATGNDYLTNAAIHYKTPETEDSDTQGIMVDSALYPQSTHPYTANQNESKTFTYPGAESLTITFSTSTVVESNYDYIYLYDGAGSQRAKYTGTQAAGKAVTIPGDSFTVKLTSDSIIHKYGYSFSSIVAHIPTYSVSVITVPNKTVYALGEALDTNGLLLMLTYSNGSTEVVTSGFTVQGFDSTTAGTKTLTVTYNGQTATFNVYVKSILASGTCGNQLLWSLDESGILTISGVGDMANYMEYEVYSAPWYSYRDTINEIKILSGVTGIGDYAFKSCYRVTSVTIADTVERIGNSAFWSCSYLTSISIPDGVKTIGYSAFSGCSRLYYVNIPGSVTSLKPSAFHNCTSLYSLTLGSGLAEIGEDAFRGCSNLATITIPGSVKTIGNYAFADCTKLSKVTISDGVTAIGNYAFYYCSSLTSIIIPNSVTTIGQSAFMYSKLSEVTIPESIVSIGANAFSCPLTKVNITDMAAWCEISFASLAANPVYTAHNLYLNGVLVTDLVIPDGVTSIGQYAFEKCYSLTSIKIPDSVKSIGTEAFYDCSGVTEVNLGNGVTEIGYGAFRYDNFTSITIPDSVTSIGECAFDSCNKLKDVHYDGTQGRWNAITIGSRNEPLLNANLHCWIPFVYETVNGEVTITDCDTSVAGTLEIPATIDGYPVTTIGNAAFADCTQLTSIVIPDSVTWIGYGVFERCRNLTSVTFSSNFTRITDWMFDGCENLTEIVIPNGVTEIGYGAFNSCVRLNSITIPASLDYIGPGAFNSCIGLTDVYISDVSAWCKIDFNHELNDYSMPKYNTPMYYARKLHILDAEGNEVTEVVLDSTVTTIPALAFKGCSEITGITIPDSVTAIGEGAFNTCAALQDVYYAGREAQWNAIYVADYNAPLLNARLHCELFAILDNGVLQMDSDITTDALTLETGQLLDLNGQVLTVDSLVSFGQIIDSVGGGGLVVTNLEITGNDWLPIQDSTGCYRFYEYEVSNLGTKTDSNSVTFGFTLDFEDANAYTTLLDSEDVQLTVTLQAGENSQTYAFSKSLIQKYVDWVAKYSELRPYMKLNVTGIDSLADGTALTVTPAITAVGGKVNSIGKGMQYIA